MKRYLIIVNLILVAGIAYFGVHAGYRLAALPLAGRSVAPEPGTFKGTGELTAPRPLAAYRVIADRNLFNTRGPAAPRAAADDVAANLSPTALKLTLRGTVSGGGGSAYAVIEDDQDRRQHLYRQGDEVGGAVIQRIFREKVILRVDGSDEILAMAERGAADQAAAADPAPSGPKAGGDTAGRVTVSSAEIKAATGDLSNLAQQATIRPHFVSGKRDGFLLARVQPRSVFSRLGLRTGDVLKRVDGQVLTSVGQALTLYQSLTPGSEVDVLISRQGVDRTLSYSIE